MAKTPKKKPAAATKPAAAKKDNSVAPTEKNNDVASTKNDSDVAPKDTGSVQNAQLIIHNQYIKDLSLENPNAPQVFMEKLGQPEVEVNVNVNATPINEERLFEVVLSIRATAKQDSKDVFIAELSYAAILGVPKELAENAVHPIVMIEGPRMIFPFARAILSDITQAGGFMPLNIQPIDFTQVYQQGIRNMQEKGNA